MKTDRIEVTAPEGYKEALTKKARQKKMSLGRWLLSLGVEELPVRTQQKLPPLRERGRPTIE